MGDGSLSVWRVFYDNDTNDTLNGNNEEGLLKISAIAAICLVVFVPRFLDEQGLFTDLCWEPDGSGFITCSDDSSLTSVKFNNNEIYGELVQNRHSDRCPIDEANQPNSDLINMI